MFGILFVFRLNQNSISVKVDLPLQFILKNNNIYIVVCIYIIIMETYLAEKLFLVVILVTIVLFAIYDLYFEND